MNGGSSYSSLHFFATHLSARSSGSSTTIVLTRDVDHRAKHSRRLAIGLSEYSDNPIDRNNPHELGFAKLLLENNALEAARSFVKQTFDCTVLQYLCVSEQI